MPKGGSRNRSGPAADPGSGRSQRRKLNLRMLPAAGYKGRAPAYPLPARDVIVYVEGVPVVNEQASKVFRKRELELWRQLWRTPQAAAWSLPENTFRHRHIAMYCRISVRAEEIGASPSLLAQLHRLADQAALTTAGLREMGWDVESTVDGDAVSSDAAISTSAPVKPYRASARDRQGLKLVAGSGGA